MKKKPSKTIREEFRSNLLTLSGRLTEERTADVINNLVEMCADPNFDRILLAINSGGGSVYQAFAIYDVIHSLSKPVDTIVAGMTHSAAVVVLQAGRKRYSLPNGDLFIHEIGTDYKERLTAHDLQNEYRNSKMVADRMLRVLSQKTGRPSKKILTDCKKSMSFGSAEALDYGLIDEVIRDLDSMIEYYYAVF